MDMINKNKKIQWWEGEEKDEVDGNGDGDDGGWENREYVIMEWPQCRRLRLRVAIVVAFVSFVQVKQTFTINRINYLSILLSFSSIV